MSYLGENLLSPAINPDDELYEFAWKDNKIGAVARWGNIEPRPGSFVTLSRRAQSIVRSSYW